MSKPIIAHLADFVEYCDIEKGLSPKTGKNYIRFLQNFFRWLEENALEKLEPQELTEKHIQKYGTWLSQLPNKIRMTASRLHTSTQTTDLSQLT